VDRSGDVLQVVEDLLLTDAQNLRNSAEVQRFFLQKVGDFFSNRWHHLMGRGFTLLNIIIQQGKRRKNRINIKAKTKRKEI